jgi:hypothetical protein
MAVTGRHPRAFGIHDRRTHRKRGRFHATGQIDGFFGLDRPGVKQREVFRRAFERVRVGQPGKAVFAGKAGDFIGCLDGLGNRFVAEIAGTGVALSVTDIDRDAQSLVAGLLDGLDLALAHIDRQARALGDVGGCSGGTELCGTVEHRLGEFFETGAAVVEHGERPGQTGTRRSEIGGNQVAVAALVAG